MLMKDGASKGLISALSKDKCSSAEKWQDSSKFCPSQSPFLGTSLSLALGSVPSATCQVPCLPRAVCSRRGCPAPLRESFLTPTLIDQPCCRVGVAWSREQNQNHAHRRRHLGEASNLASVEVWGCKGGSSGVFRSGSG